MYDLGEEVSIRGKASTNASLRLCRINEAQEELTPSNMRNALYVTEKGRIYCYDLKGTKVDIAGSVYAGAVSAGYTDSPLKFGMDLYELIRKNNESQVVRCTGIRIQESNKTLNTNDIGVLVALSAIKSPAGCTESIQWASSNKETAIIKSSNDTTADIAIMGEGMASITAKCGSYTATRTITVEAAKNVKFNVFNGASWYSANNAIPSLGGNINRAFTYAGASRPPLENISAQAVDDSSYSYGIPLKQGVKYIIELSTDSAAGCYYGLQLYSSISKTRIVDSGWKAAGTKYEYTPSSDGIYLYSNFKYGSAGSTSISDEILEKIKTAFSIMIEG